MDLLRINTAGSVDDGKSTLIGRFLYDCGALTKEQQQLVEQKTKEKGMNDLDFSVITDGLIAEREQGITIDVAHIYFSTASRKFIIADSPGHVEYTRNMVTGASNSEISIILIDARKGLLEQTYRHYFISRLLRLHTVVFCINKMDLVHYSEDVFLKTAADVNKMIAQFPDVTQQFEIIPVSSLKGDNIVSASQNMSWYRGKSLSEVLHSLEPKKPDTDTLRYEVQQVLHVQNDFFSDYRAFAGKVINGTICVGDSITVLPSLQTSRVIEIRKFTSTFNEAKTGASVHIRLEDEIDCSRGSMIVRTVEDSLMQKQIKATLVWMDESPLNTSARYNLQASSRVTISKILEIQRVISPQNPLETKEAETLYLNDIAEVTLKCAQPVFLDHFSKNRSNGAFILIDLQTNNTVAVGFLE